MVPFSIAGIQTHVGALHSNLDALLHKLDITVSNYPWIQMVLLSELATTGPLTHHAQPPKGPAESAYREAAAKHGIWLLPGSIYETAADGKIYNTIPVINPQGDIVARCTKLFPFLPYEVNVAAGSEFCLFDVPDVGRFGASICYDIWIPEINRAIEVKADLKSQQTGNVVIEIEMFGRPSGLLTTKADDWVICTGDYFYWIEPQELIKQIKKLEAEMDMD